jgi:hypothetical protein
VAAKRKTNVLLHETITIEDVSEIIRSYLELFGIPYQDTLSMANKIIELAQYTSDMNSCIMSYFLDKFSNRLSIGTLHTDIWDTFVAELSNAIYDYLEALKPPIEVNVYWQGSEAVVEMSDLYDVVTITRSHTKRTWYGRRKTRTETRTNYVRRGYTFA